MRNLRNIKHTAIRFDASEAPLAATTWDGDSVICAFGPSELTPAITLKRFTSDAWRPEDGILITSWDAPSPNPDLAFDRILSLHCFPDTGVISLVLEGGDIYVVREDPQAGEELIEIVGSVDAGIAAAAWSPDEELLIIASKADTLLFMTRDFEGTANIDLSSEDLKVSNHVSVGWGKKETQFQGPRAKALRDPTVPEHIDEGKLSSYDDSRTSISWRGDGQYVAINSILEVPDLKRRVIRVFSREGVLDSVSEPVDGLEGALSWKPSGQLLASIQRQDDRADVVFFERNGLRHGEFSLRFTKDELDAFGGDIALDWNNDSSVLAVSTNDRVQLWTMGNYHYYLKQEILRGRELHGLVRTDWHPERPLHLSAFVPQGLRVLAYSSEVSRSSLVPPWDMGTVAVIDGSRLKITPLRTANVPPPMAFDEIETPGNIADVAISANGMRLAVLHHDRISVWKCNYSSKPAKKAELLETLHLDLPPDEAGRQIAFDEDDLMVISSSVNTQGTRINTVSDFGTSASRSELDVPFIFHPTNHQRLLLENNKGVIHDLKTKELLGTLPIACPDLEVWQTEDITIVFGLTATGMLHVKSDIQALKVSGCTSFAVTATHLIYTTSSHLIKFVHLHDGQLEVPPDEPEKDERCRNIERGAKLVTVMPSAYCLVLQMPRGNLETIYPRALVLAGIRAAISERNYKKAFKICRTQRVDMNILHDYAPVQFMNDIDLFIEQVKKVESIDLFLSSLSDEDVSQTIYKETLKPQTASNGVNGVNGVVNGDASHATASTLSKTNKICDAFLTVLAARASTHLQSIVTAHVCKSPPDLEAGLSLVSRLRKEQKQEELEQAVEHICFLADVNRLYDTVLGLYDLDVTLLVAQQSQKDPREYLPYLQSLHDMEPLRQRHAIDNDLKRYSKALSHLHALEAFDEVKTYAAKHELYSSAIELYRYDNARLIELMQIYADFLSSRNRYREAGVAYEYIGDYTAAYEAYRSASQWRECLACAGLVGLSDEKIAEIAQDLAEACEESKEYISASTIYLEYLDDLPTAARLLCKAYQFSEAARLIAKRRRPDLLKDVIDAGLVEASATITELLAEMRTQLQHQIPRLRELRLKKEEDPMAFLDSGDVNADIPDDISLAPTDATTSAGTFMTRYTNRSMGTLATNATRKTSKNKRREERKRARGKKGTVYEEEYLVNSISRLIERLNETGNDVTRLVEGLMRRAMRERAVAVQAAFVEVQNACKQCMDEVYAVPVPVPSAHEEGINGNGPELHRPWGGQGVLFDALQESQVKREKPVLKAFERLSLLDN
ncbi:Elongator complex protein 1 [Pseudocercospora fuligena]|uniref:Elongator complex protein 1 n=1 Tax=Pseudocercospora fuligena TaxID=685502 RepID=A0A8H6R667_9PEZI|nr:Elongator complex protein 1 [Pseudocercospora fuligena]